MASMIPPLTFSLFFDKNGHLDHSEWHDRDIFQQTERQKEREISELADSLGILCS